MQYGRRRSLSAKSMPGRVLAIGLAFVLCLAGTGLAGLAWAGQPNARAIAQGGNPPSGSHSIYLPLVLKAATTPATSTFTPTPTATDTPSGWTPPTELLVYDWNGPVTKADHGYAREAPPRAEANGNWNAPVNLAQGTLYYRIVIAGQPVAKSMRLQFCLWQYSRHLENCGPVLPISGTPGATVTASGRVEAMYMSNGQPIDWAQPRDAVGVVIKNAASLPVSDLNNWNWSGENPDEWYPLNVRLTVVAVAKGASFSGWDYWSAPTPTATLTGTATDTPTPTATLPSGSWWDARWRARFRIQVSGAGYQRTDRVVELPVNLTDKLQDAGLSGSLDLANLRLIETDPDGYALNDQVPFQFDQDPGYSAADNASGQLIFLAEGTTGPTQTRTFYAYFDTTANASDKTPAEVAPRVIVQDGVEWEGQTSYRIVTQNATYYYHKRGGAFASMIDAEGRDWIGYHPDNGAAGNYRGVPNLASDLGGQDIAIFHPGETKATSSISHSGPLKLTILSTTGDGGWQARWEVYPQYARMTLVTKPINEHYWFLYEGPPGGSVDNGDYFVLPDGVRHYLSADYNRDLPGDEWVYYGDDQRSQVLFAASHQEDTATDTHFISGRLMAVWGFGRDANYLYSKLLRTVPAQFTIGFLDHGAQATVAEGIRSAYKPLDIWVWYGEYPGMPTPVATSTPTSTPTVTSTPTRTPTPTTAPFAHDELLAFDWNRPLLKADHGFGMERPPRPQANGDWTTPFNFAEGTLYYRAEIRSQPVSQQMLLQWCSWQMGVTIEACGLKYPVSGIPGNVVTWQSEVAKMWKKDGVHTDWTQERTKYGFGVMLPDARNVSDLNDWNWAGQNPDDWYPLDLRFTVVVVAKGGTFSGWDWWLNGIPPTPPPTVTSTPTETPLAGP